MKSTCLLFIFLSLSTVSKSRCQAYYAYEVERPRYCGFGLTGSVQGFRYFGWGIGIGYNSVETDWRYLGGSIVKIEYENCAEMQTQLIKAGGSVYAFQNFFSVLIGMNVVNCFHEHSSYFGIRPEVGYGIGFLNITYGRNVLGKKTTEFIPKNVFALNFYVPVKNKRKNYHVNW